MDHAELIDLTNDIDTDNDGETTIEDREMLDTTCSCFDEDNFSN